MDYSLIFISEALDLTVTQLGVGLNDAQKNIVDTKGCNAIFLFLKDNYNNHLIVAENNVGDDAHVSYRRQCALNTYFLFLIGTTIIMNENATYDDVVHSNYFTGLESITGSIMFGLLILQDE